MVTAEIVSDGNASFLRAARAGNLEKVLEYLKGNVDINTSNANGLNALHLASKEGHVYVVTELLKKGANVNAATKKGNTALHIASLAGQDEVVRVLVNLGANVNAQSQNGFTPLYMAAQENHDHVVSFLLSNGANQSLSTEDGFTPLAVALQQGHDRVVAVLLENDTKGKVRLPALHIAAKKNDCKAAALLLQNDHNPDVTSKSGFTPLHISAHYGNENVGNILMDKGADVNFTAKHQITPLHVASKWGKSNMVALLIAKGANIEASTRDGLTPLHCAARSGHDQVVDELLEKGAPILAKTKNGLAPLHMASQGDHVDSARILLYHKAPVDDVTVDYLTALHVAAHCGHVKVAKLLLDRKADPNARALNGFTPLHIACKKNRIKVVELLLKHGASIEATTESGLTPLHVASFMGCMNIVIYLIQNGANPDVPTVRGETPLHLAARANQTDIIRILLRNGASVDARAREDQTPLHIASRLGNVDIVSLLLQHGAAVDATTKDMYTALHIAAKEDQEEVSSVLLDHGASLVSTTKKGFTPLHLAAKYGNIKVARLLLQKDAPVDAEGKNGVTPLHVAAHYDHVNVALLLLDKGASPHAKAKNGYTPLHIAAKKNQMDIATTLLEYAAESNTESKAGFTPLHLASQEGHTDIASLLIEHNGDVNHKANNGLTPLHLCAQNDRVNVATVLVENGAEIAPQTKAGYTPLHVASHFGQINMAKYLLQQNANVNITTMYGYTPLHQAAQQGHTLAVNLLLENNASPNVLTSQGQTPLSIAQRLGYISVVETLKVVTETTVTTTTTTVTEEKYKVVAPETMQETFMTDSEDEGGEDTMLGDQSYRYLTVDEMKSLGDDSLPMDVTKDERQYDTMHLVKETAAPVVEEDNLSPQHITPIEVGFSEKYSPDNIDISHTPLHTGRLKWKTFLVSFMVDARGGAMRGCRHSGVRVIIPPRKASMPMRITCRYLRKEKLIHPPPLMEGEACASRILEVGPVGAQFLGPVIIEVPHFASLRGKEREIIILRSDTGETWLEHTFEASDEAIRDVLNESFEGEEFSALEDLNTSRITRILTTDFPQYFAIITRIRQEVHSVGPEGGIVSSTVVPQVQTIFPDGALTKKIKVGLQAQPIAPELVAKLLGNRVAVSPVVTVEPRRRKFHKPITLTIPVPQAATKGMINQYSGDAPTLRLLCSITGGSSKAQWEDVTGSTPLTFVNDCVSFTTTVSARFWLMDCRQVSEASKFATELYQEAVHVPFMSKFVVFAKRNEPNEAHLRVFCMTDDKEDKTLETQEHFTEIAKSRDVEVLEGKLQFLEFAGNLVPVTKSGEQLQLTFQAFHENRIPFMIRVKDPHMEPMGRIAFMKEPKVGRGEPPQVPICNLNVALPEILVAETPVGLELVTLEKKDDFVHESGLSKPEAIHRADLRLSDIARELDKDWLNLAHQLEVSELDINSAKYECLEDPCEQALIMLRIWLQKAGSKGTGNELEKALRKINREDIIQKCMINVERVTDDVEKAVAKVQLDQSGFDVFKEELGSSREASMRRGASLDISYDEQDVMKDAESAAETSSETGSIFEREQISQVFSDDKESMIRRVSKTPPPSPEVSEKFFECIETKVSEKAIELEIPEQHEVIVKQVQTVFVKSADLIDMQEINLKMTESETWPSGEMDTSQVSVSSLPDDEKSEPTTATVSSATAAEPDIGDSSEEMREWTEVDESGTVKHIIHKTTHMTLSVQQKQDGTSDIEAGTNSPLPALEASVEPGSQEDLYSESTSPVIEQNASPESPQLSFAEKCDFFNKLSVSSSSQSVTPSLTLKSTVLEEVGTHHFVCDDASGLVDQLNFAERLKIFENTDVSEHPSGSVTDIKTEVWTISNDINIARTEDDSVSRNFPETDIPDVIGSKESPRHIPEALELTSSCETLLDTKVEVLVKQYEPGKEAIEICSVESTHDEKEIIKPDKSELLCDSRMYFNREDSEKGDLKKIAEAFSDSEKFSGEKFIDASAVESRLPNVTSIIHTASQSDISCTNRLAEKTSVKESLAVESSELSKRKCEIELLAKTGPLEEILGMVEKFGHLSSYAKNQVPADDALFPTVLTTMNIPHVTDMKSKNDGSITDEKSELEVTTLSHDGTNILEDPSSDTIRTKVICSLSETLESKGSLGDRLIKDLENEIIQPEADDRLYYETIEVLKVSDVAFVDTKHDYDNETVSTNGIMAATVKAGNAVDVRTGGIFESRPSPGLDVKTIIPTEGTPEIEDCIIDEIVDEIKSSKYTSSEIISSLSKEPKHGVSTDEIAESICTALKLPLDEKAMNNNSKSHSPPKIVTKFLSPEKQALDSYDKDELFLHLSKGETINLDIVESESSEISEGLLEKVVSSGEERSPDILEDGFASSVASLTLETVKVFTYKEGNVNVIGMDNNGSYGLSEERLHYTVEDGSKIYPMQKKNVQDAAESECEESGDDFQKLSSFGKINEPSESSFVTDIKVGINKSFNVDSVEYYPGDEVDDKVESMIENLRTSVETQQAKLVDTASEEVTEKNRQAFKLDYSSKLEKPENQHEQSSSSGEIFICTEQTLDNVKMILSAAEAESSIVLPNIDVYSCNQMETDSKSCETAEIPETLHKSCEDIDKLEEEISDASELKYQEEEKELHESTEEIMGTADSSALKYQKREKDHLESPDKVNDTADITESKYREEVKELSKSSESIDGKYEFSVSVSLADRSFEVNNVEIVPVLEVSEEVSKVSVDMTGHEALGTSCSFHKEMTSVDHIRRAPESVGSDIKLKPEIFCDLVEKADFEDVEKKTLNDTDNKIELAEAVFQRICTDENRKEKETWESVEITHHKDLSKDVHSIPSSKVTSKISCKERQYEKDSYDYPATLHKLDDFLKSVTQVDANNEEPSFSSNVEVMGTRTEEWVNKSGEDLLKDGNVRDYNLEAIENGLCEEQAHTLDDEFQKRSSPTAESFDDEARVERCDTDIMMQLLDYVSRSDIELAEVRTEDEAPDIEEDVSPSAEEESPNKTLHEDPKFADSKMDKSVPETMLCTQTSVISKDNLMNEPDDENILLSPLKSSFDSVTSPSRKDADVTAREIKTLEEDEGKAESETKKKDLDSPCIDCGKQPLADQGKGHSDSCVVEASDDRILSFESADVVHINTSEHVQHDVKMPGKQSVGCEDKLFHHLPKDASAAFSEEVEPNSHAPEENRIHQPSTLFSKEACAMNFQDTSNFREMHETDLFTSAFIAIDLAPKVDVINTEVKQASNTMQIDSSEKFAALGFVNTGFVGAELIDASEESVEFRSRSPYEVLRDDQGVDMSELHSIKLEKPVESADSVNTDSFRKEVLKKHDYVSFCSENIVSSSKTSASDESSFSSSDRYVSENTRREVRQRPILQHIPSEISEEDLVEKEITSPVLKEELFASGFLCNDFFDGSNFETFSTRTCTNISQFRVEDFGTKLSSDVSLETKHSDNILPKASESKELKNDIATASADESLISQVNGLGEVDYKPEYDECKFSTTQLREMFDDPITLAVHTNETSNFSNVDVIEPKEIIIASSTEVIKKGLNPFCERTTKEISLQTIHVLEELPILSQDLVEDTESESTRLACFSSISDDIVDAEIGSILRSEVQVEDDIIERPLTPEPPEQFHMLETEICSLSCLGEASAFCEESANVKVMSQTFREEFGPSIECSDFHLNSDISEKFLRTQLQKGLVENEMVSASASKMVDDFTETSHDFNDSIRDDLNKKETVGSSQHHIFQGDSDDQTKLFSWPVGCSTEILALTDFSSTKPDVAVHGEGSSFPYGMQFEKDVDEQMEEAMDIDSDQCSKEKNHLYNYGMRFEREQQDLDDDDDDDDIPGYGDLYTHQEEDEDIIDESEKEKLPYLSLKVDKYVKPNAQEFDTLAGRKFFCKNGELDDLSLSSLQEFERLEEEFVSGRKSSIGSMDSFNGKPIHSKSGEHDDVSMNSLTEFEKLERECAEAERAEAVSFEVDAHLSEIEEGHESQASETSQETMLDIEKDDDLNEPNDYDDSLVIDKVIENAQSSIENLNEMSSTKYFVSAAHHSDDKTDTFSDDSMSASATVVRVKKIESPFNVFTETNVESAVKSVTEAAQILENCISVTEKKQVIRSPCLSFERPLCIIDHKNPDTRDFKVHIFEHAKRDDVDQDSLHDDQSMKPDSLSGEEKHDYQDSLLEDKSGEYDSLQDEMHEEMKDSLHEERQIDEDSLHEMEMPLDESSLSLESSAAALIAFPYDSSKIDLSEAGLGKFVDIKRDTNSDLPKSLNLGLTLESVSASHVHNISISDIDIDKGNVMISSTDSLEHSSSAMTHATYQFETESVMSSSINSVPTSDDFTMISSSDALEPDIKVSSSYSNFSVTEMEALGKSGQQRIFLDSEGNIQETDNICTDSEGNLQTILSCDTLRDEAKSSYPLPIIHTYGTTGSSRIGINYTKPSMQQHPQKLKSDGLYPYSEETSVQRSSIPEVEGISMIGEKSEHKVVCKIKQTTHRIPAASDTESTSESIDEKFREFLRTRVLGAGQETCEEELQQEKIIDEKGNVVIVNTVKCQFVSRPEVHSETFTGPEAERFSNEFIKSFKLDTAEKHDHFETVDADGNIIHVTQHTILKPTMQAVSFSGPEAHKQMEEYMKHWSEHETGDKTSVDISDIIENSESFQASTSFQSHPSIAGRSPLTDLTRNYEVLSDQELSQIRTTATMVVYPSSSGITEIIPSASTLQGQSLEQCIPSSRDQVSNDTNLVELSQDNEEDYIYKNCSSHPPHSDVQ